MEVSIISWRLFLGGALARFILFWKANISLSLELIALGKHHRMLGISMNASSQRDCIEWPVGAHRYSFRAIFIMPEFKNMYVYMCVWIYSIYMSVKKAVMNLALLKAVK